jgi:hypothetical protein
MIPADAQCTTAASRGRFSSARPVQREPDYEASRACLIVPDPTTVRFTRGLPR